MKGGNNISRRWKWNVYLLTIVLVLLFGSAIVGLMGLHRLRETRLFQLLVKEKDHQIISLQFHLQKERERVREERMKMNEMRIKAQSLGGEKMVLMRRISEMGSTITSLKDEQRVVELAFQEKQNEVKLLKDKYVELVELLRQSEAEIEDTKRHRFESSSAVNNTLGAYKGNGEDFGSENRVKQRGEVGINNAVVGNEEHKQSTETTEFSDSVNRQANDDKNFRTGLMSASHLEKQKLGTYDAAHDNVAKGVLADPNSLSSHFSVTKEPNYAKSVDESNDQGTKNDKHPNPGQANVVEKNEDRAQSDS